MLRTIASAWASSSARWSTTPLVRACTSPPPSSSAVTTSPVAAFTSGGPPRKIVPWLRTMTLSSDMAGHVGAAGGARAHHAGDLRDAPGREVGLVEEDPAEVLPVGEHVVLHRQERAAGVDEVDARQPVLGGDCLRAQVLLHRDRVVGAALDRRVVGDDHGLPAADPADAGDDAGAGHGVAVHPGRGERAQLEERAARVEQPVHPVAHQQLAAPGVLLARRLRAARRATASRSRRSATSSRISSATPLG